MENFDLFRNDRYQHGVGVSSYIRKDLWDCKSLVNPNIRYRSLELCSHTESQLAAGITYRPPY